MLRRSCEGGRRVLARDSFSLSTDFLTSALAICNGPQNGIQRGSGGDEFHCDSGNNYSAEALDSWAQVNRIFFGSDKAIGVAMCSGAKQVGDILVRIGVVIGVEALRDWNDAAATQFFQESLRARDPTEHDRARRRIGDHHAALHAPDDFAGV